MSLITTVAFAAILFYFAGTAMVLAREKRTNKCVAEPFISWMTLVSIVCFIVYVFGVGEYTTYVGVNHTAGPLWVMPGIFVCFMVHAFALVMYLWRTPKITRSSLITFWVIWALLIATFDVVTGLGVPGGTLSVT